MEPSPEDVKRYIAQGLDCERVEVDGDGRHFQALIVSAAFAGKKPRGAPPAGLRGAGRAHARGSARAVDAHADSRGVPGQGA
jgi:hypothetical protein